MKQTTDKASRLSLGTVFVMGIVIVVLHAAGAVAAEMKGACERDPDHTLQQLIESKAVGSDRVPKDIESILWMGSMDIESQSTKEIWSNTLPTYAFYWPVLNEQFIRFRISCPTCFRLAIKCHVSTPGGFAMFAFRHTDGTLLYVSPGYFTGVPRE